MTFIQPSKNSVLFRLFLALIVAGLVGGTFLLTVLYNKTVNLNHEISVAKAELDSVGAANTALNNQIVTMLGVSDPAVIAAQGGLVAAKPQYVTVAQ